MNWNLKDEYTNWNSEITNIEGKEKVAKKIANLVKDGDVIGFGSGSTSFLAVKEISKKIKTTNIKITAIPTSYEIKFRNSNRIFIRKKARLEF